MNSTVARCCAATAASASGAGRSTSSVAAPIDSGNRQQPAQPERERERRAAGEEIVGRRPQHVHGPAAAGGDEIAVEMHRPLRLAGRPRRESNEACVVAGRDDVGERGRLRRHQRLEVGGAGAAEEHHRFQRRATGARRIQILGEPRIAQRVRDLGLGDDVGQLLRAKQRHRAHRDPARLQHAEPARRDHRIVGRPEQHAIAGDEAQILGQDARDAIGLREELAIRPAHPSGGKDRRALAPAALDGAVEQLGRDVHPRWNRELRQIEDQLRPGFARRQVVAGVGVDVGGHRVLPVDSPSSSRATMSFCTSVAPS